MFSKLAVLTYVVALAAGVTRAVPTPEAAKRTTDLAARGGHGFSFDNWRGISSLNGFDSFYGSGSFDGFHQHQVLEEQSQELVCHSQSIEIIQQRLVVLQEMAKKIITEQVCEVETQTIVFQQYYSSLGFFSDDLRRRSGRHVGYDDHIVSHYGSFYNSDGSLSTNDWGFHGTDIGSNFVVPSGSNWVDSTSHGSVDAAFFAARNARLITHHSH